MLTNKCTQCNSKISTIGFMYDIMYCNTSLICNNCSHILVKDLGVLYKIFYLVFITSMFAYGIFFGVKTHGGSNISTIAMAVLDLDKGQVQNLAVGIIPISLIIFYLVSYIILLVLKFEKEPNKSLKSGTPKSGAP